jgi:hypothetical protein
VALPAAAAMDRARALHLERAAIDEALASSRAELRRAQAQARSHARAWVLTAPLRREVLIVYVLAGYDTEPAAHYLRKVAARRKWPPMDTDVLKLVEDAFMSADPDEIAALTDAVAPSDPAAMQSASKCVEEWRLVRWARDQNTGRGVAPTTDALLQRLASDRLACGHDEPHGRGTAIDASARMWATRFRRRWGGRVGSIGTSPTLPASDMRAKAWVTGQVFT